jgi:hypothetical protein
MEVLFSLFNNKSNNHQKKILKKFLSKYLEKWIVGVYLHRKAVQITPLTFYHHANTINLFIIHNVISKLWGVSCNCSVVEMTLKGWDLHWFESNPPQLAYNL